MQAAELWGAMAPSGKVVVAILVLLSLYSFAVMVERSRVMSRTRQASDAFSSMFLV